MKNITYQKAFEIYLGFIALVICIFPKLITIAIIGLALFTIFGYIKKKITFNLKWPVALFSILYLMYLTGTVFSQNHHLSNLYIENKLSFIVFPILLSFRFKEKMDLRALIYGLNLGVLIIGLLGIFNGIKCINLAETTSISCFLASSFSYIHHPSYFSVYILIALFSSWFGYFNKWKSFKLTWIIPFSVVGLIFYGLCLSLAAFLFLFMLIIVLFLFFTYQRYGRKVFVGSLFIAPILALILFYAIPQIRDQFITSEEVFTKYVQNPEKYVKSRTGYKQGDETRVIMWTATYHGIAEHPFGVGTGNVDLYLSRKLTSYGQHEMAKMDEKGTIVFNPHNQFLQTGLEIGVQGLIVFLMIFVSGIIFAIKHKNWILLLLLSSLFFNSLIESMLQRQSGIVFYSFLVCVLVIYSSSNRDNKLTSLPQDL